MLRPAPASPASADATSTLILDAAERRLRRFGPEKLTVLDIAREAGMSHPNLYRFFASKAAILNAIVDRWLASIEVPLAAIAAGPGTAGERLQRFMLEHHRIKAGKITCEAELFRAFGTAINAAAPAAIERHAAALRDLLAGMVRDGVQSGEFAADIDPPTAARMLREATVPFHHPQLLPVTLAEFGCADRLCELVRLLLAGLRSRDRETLLRTDT